MKIRMAGAALALLAAPALAQTPTPAATTVAVSPDAQAIAALVLPNGTYRELMSGSLKQFMHNMPEQMSAMQIGPILRAAGLQPDDAQRLDKATLGQVMAIVDPAYQQRTQRMMDSIFPAIGEIMTRYEPDMRAGLAEAYQRRFTSAELADIRRYVATPTGAKWAGTQFSVMADPAFVGRIQQITPALMQEMPRLMQTAIAGMKDLPAPKKAKDLTPDDKRRLAQLLGIDPAKFDASKVAE